MIKMWMKYELSWKQNFKFYVVEMALDVVCNEGNILRLSDYCK